MAVGGEDESKKNYETGKRIYVKALQDRLDPSKRPLD
jgi:hypothetical protein